MLAEQICFRRGVGIDHPSKFRIHAQYYANPKISPYQSGSAVRVPHPLRSSNGGGLDSTTTGSVEMAGRKIPTLAKTARMGHPAVTRIRKSSLMLLFRRPALQFERQGKQWRAFRPLGFRGLRPAYAQY